jgi:hypothetical protein
VPKSEYNIVKTGDELIRTLYTPSTRNTEQARTEVSKVPIVMTAGQKDMLYKFLLTRFVVNKIECLVCSVSIHPLVLAELDKQLNLLGKGAAYTLKSMETSCADFMETTFTNYRLEKVQTVPQNETTNKVLNGELPNGITGYEFPLPIFKVFQPKTTF